MLGDSTSCRVPQAGDSVCIGFGPRTVSHVQLRTAPFCHQRHLHPSIVERTGNRTVYERISDYWQEDLHEDSTYFADYVTLHGLSAAQAEELREYTLPPGIYIFYALLIAMELAFLFYFTLRQSEIFRHPLGHSILFLLNTIPWFVYYHLRFIQIDNDSRSTCQLTGAVNVIINFFVVFHGCVAIGLMFLHRYASELEESRNKTDRRSKVSWVGGFAGSLELENGKSQPEDLSVVLQLLREIKANQERPASVSLVAFWSGS